MHRDFIKMKIKSIVPLTIEIRNNSIIYLPLKGLKNQYYLHRDIYHEARTLVRGFINNPAR